MKIDKKICLFVSSLRGGGAERVAVNLANEFVTKGYQVDILTVKKEGVYLSDISKEVRVFEPYSPSSRFLRTFLMLPALIYYIKTNRPSMVISSLPRNNIIILIAQFFISKKSTKVVVSEHSNMTASFKKRNTYTDKLLLFFVKRLYSRAYRVIAVSNGIANDLISNYGVPESKVAVIHNPVDVLFIKEQSSSAIDPNVMDRKYDNIISLGRLTEAKNYPLLIKSFAKVYENNRNARLTIFGEGELRRQLEQEIEKLGLVGLVKLPGFYKNPFAYIANAKVFVLSSDWEGFGNVLVEAVVCGTPVISTDCPSGPDEILRSGKYGILVKPGSQVELSAAICEVINQSQKTQVNLKEFGRQYKIDLIAKKYVNLI
jgi:glycosyltransferase involved in cell wall biosynthesis